MRMAFPVSRIPAVNVATIPNRTPLRYPGGKTWLIPHIREWLAEANAGILVEPFAGGGIVSLTAIMEDLTNRAVMVEIDHDVAAFWHAALRDGQRMADRVLGCEPNRGMLREWESSKPKCVFEHGFRTLVLNRTRRSGILANGASYMLNGENGKGLLSRWYPATLAKRLRTISLVSERITFCEADGMKLLPHLLHGWKDRAAVFVDPPYTAGGKRAGTRLYSECHIDHPLLFEMLADCDANFLMTYDAAPEIVSLTKKHGFAAVCVVMKNAHHNRLPELVITRDRIFA